MVLPWHQVQGEHRYRGIVDAGASIVRDEGGVRGLYRGLSPTLVAIVPYAGLTFYCFEVGSDMVALSYPFLLTDCSRF